MRLHFSPLLIFLLLNVIGLIAARRASSGTSSRGGSSLEQDVESIHLNILRHANSGSLRAPFFREMCDQWRVVADGSATVRLVDAKRNCTGNATDAPNFLRAVSSMVVEVGGWEMNGTLWTPISNGTGSWSFRSSSGTWLSASTEGALSLRPFIGRDEVFRLESYTVPTNQSVPQAEAVKLSAELSGQRSLRSINGTYLRYNASRSGDVEMSPQRNACDRLIIEDFNGAVALRFDCSANSTQPALYLHPTSNRTVECTRFGPYNPWWTPVKNGDGSWSLKCAWGTYLSATADGRVSLRANAGPSEKFWLDSFANSSATPAPTTTTTSTTTTSTTTTTASPTTAKPTRSVLQRAIRTRHGTYLSGHGDDSRTVHTAPNKTEQCARWIVEVFNGTLTLRSTIVPVMYLRALPNRTVEVSEWREDGLDWTPKTIGDGSLSFKSAHGTWLSASKDGAVTLKEKVGQDEKFWEEAWTDSTDEMPIELKIILLVILVVMVIGCLAACCTSNSGAKYKKVAEPLNTPRATPVATPLPQNDSYQSEFLEMARQTQNNYSPAPIPLAPISAQAAGQRSIRSSHGLYLRAWQGEGNQFDWFVDMAPHCDTCEHWTIEDRDGKIVLKAYCWPEKFLRANRDMTVDLADHAQEWEEWTPVRNGNGSWSFRSHHGTWLRAEWNGRVSLQTHCDADEQFELGSW